MRRQHHEWASGCSKMQAVDLRRPSSDQTKSALLATAGCSGQMANLHWKNLQRSLSSERVNSCTVILAPGQRPVCQTSITSSSGSTLTHGQNMGPPEALQSLSRQA